MIINIKRRYYIGLILASINVLNPIKAMEDNQFSPDRLKKSENSIHQFVDIDIRHFDGEPMVKLHPQGFPKVDLHPVYNKNYRDYLFDELSNLQEKRIQEKYVRIITGTGIGRSGSNYTLKNNVLKLLRTDPSFEMLIDTNSIKGRGTGGYILVSLLEKRLNIRDEVYNHLLEFEARYEGAFNDDPDFCITLRPSICDPEIQRANLHDQFTIAEMNYFGRGLKEPKYFIARKDFIEVCKSQYASMEDKISARFYLAEMDYFGDGRDNPHYRLARDGFIMVIKSQYASIEDKISSHYYLAEMNYFGHAIKEPDYHLTRKGFNIVLKSEYSSDEDKICSLYFLSRMDYFGYDLEVPNYLSAKNGFTKVSVSQYASIDQKKEAQYFLGKIADLHSSNSETCIVS